MSLRAEVLRAMIAAGASAEMLVAAVEAEQAAQDAVDQAERDRKRAVNAARQQRKRDLDATFTEQGVTRNNAMSALRDVTERDERDGAQKDPDTVLSQGLEVPPSPPKGGSSPKGNTRNRGVFLPTDWEAKQRHIDKAGAAGFSRAWVFEQVDAMREWAEGNSNRSVARKADWDRAFDGWLRRAIQQELRDRARSTGPPQRASRATQFAEAVAHRQADDPSRSEILPFAAGFDPGGRSLGGPVIEPDRDDPWHEQGRDFRSARAYGH